jgi:hypothetical protein
MGTPAILRVEYKANPVVFADLDWMTMEPPDEARASMKATHTSPTVALCLTFRTYFGSEDTSLLWERIVSVQKSSIGALRDLRPSGLSDVLPARPCCTGWKILCFSGGELRHRKPIRQPERTLCRCCASQLPLRSRATNRH